MEGFGEAPAVDGGGSNPFDAGFDDPAPVVAEAVIAEAFIPAAPLDNGLGAPSPAGGAVFGGGAELDNDLFGGGDSGGGGATEVPGASNGGDEPAAVFTSPKFDDPRIEWDHKNLAALAQRAQAETKGKAEVLAKAKGFLDKQAKEREALLAKRKATNRELEKASDAAAGAVPSGAKPWERVLSVIAFNREDAKGPHVAKDTFKELSRFKAVLLAAKAADVPVKQ